MLPKVSIRTAPQHPCQQLIGGRHAFPGFLSPNEANHQAKVHITCNYSLFSKSKVQQPLDTVSMHQVGNGQACTQANKAANTVPVHDMPSRWQKLGMQGVCERLPEPLYQHQQ